MFKYLKKLWRNLCDPRDTEIHLNELAANLSNIYMEMSNDIIDSNERLNELEARLDGHVIHVQQQIGFIMLTKTSDHLSTADGLKNPTQPKQKAFKKAAPKKKVRLKKVPSLKSCRERK